jgi:hypothetical protein
MDRLDPLDREILERAFDAAWTAFRDRDPSAKFDGNEALEAILYLELVEIARSHGVGDPETLRDFVFGQTSLSRD